MNKFYVFSTPFICLILYSNCISSHLVFDVNHDLNNRTIKHPVLTQFKIIPVQQGYAHPELPENDENNFWVEYNDISGAEHSGTHVDAPVHFAKGQWTVDQIPTERFFGPVSIVDLRDKVKDNADYEITENDLTEWERVNKKNLDPLIILWTGWGSRWPDKLRYLGTESEDASQLHFPGLSKEAAQWIANRGGIHGVGIDTLSIDYGQSNTSYAHRILNRNNVFIIENLNTKSLESFPVVKPYLIVTPLKITAGSGAPVRAILLSQLPKDSSNATLEKPLLSVVLFLGLVTFFC